MTIAGLAPATGTPPPTVTPAKITGTVPTAKSVRKIGIQTKIVQFAEITG